jgi:hypothetical protein
MPTRVADPNLWHPSAAMVCVGPSQHPGRFEWERRSGASSLIDSGAPLDYSTLTQKTDEGDRTGPGAPCFLRSLRGPAPLAASLERSHNLGTHCQFGASAPATSPPQNWSPDSLRGSRLSFEWIVPGLTEVSFWNARRRLIAALEGPVRFRLVLGFTLARLSPNRCLAGGPTHAAVHYCGPAAVPSCPTEN